MTIEMVILVDESDNEVGVMEKQEAHEKALLHRAFSVLIFNAKGELLLQQRAFHKYHSGGLWTNTCCSHPRPGEQIIDAAHRRLKEEMGFDCELKFQQKFIYQVQFENGLTEHELDYVFIGQYEENPIFNSQEVSDVKWLSIDKLKQLLREKPDDFTVWFKIIIAKLYQTS